MADHHIRETLVCLLLERSDYVRADISHLGPCVDFINHHHLKKVR